MLELSSHWGSDLTYIIIYFISLGLDVLYNAVITYQWGRECRAPDSGPATFPKSGHLCSVSPSNSDAAGKASQSEMGRIPYRARARDEATIKPQPIRHVDYLSHDWKEEDIWSSWKHFVSHRLKYRDRRRLENAMWRAWTKAKNKMKTVRPETLNWYVRFVPLIYWH